MMLYNSGMEKNLTFKEKTILALRVIPFVFISLGAIAFLGGGALAFIYSIATYVAFKSAMVFVILFGCAFLFVGIGLLFVETFKNYKKHFDHKLKDEIIEEQHKTVITKKKAFVTFQNICFGIMIVGAIFVIVSAGLGVTSVDNWKNATASFYSQNGYYPETKSYEIAYDSTNPDRSIENIVLDLKTKNVVIIYTEDYLLTVKGYETYPSQIAVAYGGGTVRIWENPAPSADSALKRMLGFMFDENEAEAQIRVYIPYDIKDRVTITGEYVIAKN